MPTVYDAATAADADVSDGAANAADPADASDGDAGQWVHDGSMAAVSMEPVPIAAAVFATEISYAARAATAETAASTE